MDGTRIYLSVFSLALAQIYGVDITGGVLLSVVISIIVLSIGAPGVPVEAVGLVMGIDPLIGMLRCMSNCLGDVGKGENFPKNISYMQKRAWNTIPRP